MNRSRSPEDIERMKNIALTGAGLAATSLALRYRKQIGERMASAEIWEKSESVVLDWIGEGKEKSIRLYGKVIRNAANKIIEVDKVRLAHDDGSESQISLLEDVFPQEAENAQATPLQKE